MEGKFNMLGLGTPELIVILVILLVLVGGSQLPKLARSLGSSAKELKDGFEKGDQSLKDATTPSDKAKQKTAKK